MHSFVLHRYDMFSTGTDVGSSTKNKTTSWCSGNWYSYGGKAHWMLLHSIELMCRSVVVSRHNMAWFSPLFHETLCHMMLIWVTFMWLLTERDRLLKSDTGHVGGFSTSYFFPQKVCPSRWPVFLHGLTKHSEVQNWKPPSLHRPQPRIWPPFKPKSNG